MPKTKVNVKAFIQESKAINKKIKEGISNASLTAKDKEDLISELENIIKLTEQLKSDIN